MSPEPWKVSATWDRLRSPLLTNRAEPLGAVVVGVAVVGLAVGAVVVGGCAAAPGRLRLLVHAATTAAPADATAAARNERRDTDISGDAIGWRENAGRQAGVSRRGTSGRATVTGRGPRGSRCWPGGLGRWC